MTDSIAGKVVAITGASSGIGAAAAELLATRGAKVVLGARGGDRLRRTVDRIQASGGDAVWTTCDVTRPDDLVQLAALAVSTHGRLDVLISNAGFGPVAPIADLRTQDWRDVVEINFMGVLWGVAAALPVFERQGSGHFVQTLSTSGLKIVPGQAVYAAAKNATRTFVEALRQEVGPTIRVTSVSPGMVATDFASSAPDEQTRAQMLARRDEMAIGPDAIARAMAYAIEQPADVDVNEIVIRPAAQG